MAVATSCTLPSDLPTLLTCCVCQCIGSLSVNTLAHEVVASSALHALMSKIYLFCTHENACLLHRKIHLSHFETTTCRDSLFISSQKAARCHP